MLPSRAALAAAAVVLGLVASSSAHAAEVSEKKKPSRPEVYKVRPASGDTDGGTVIMLRGKFFTGTKKVMFDRTPAASFQVVSDKQLRIVSPPHLEGLFRIWVTTKQGRAKPGAFDGFRFVDDSTPPPPPPPPPLAPGITGLSPNKGPIGGGTTVTITGTNFTAGAEVVFGDRAATSVTVNSTTSITVTAPSFSGLLGGDVDVRVTTTAGQTPNTAADNYRYQGLLG